MKKHFVKLISICLVLTIAILTLSSCVVVEYVNGVLDDEVSDNDFNVEPNKGSIETNEDGSIILREELIASLSNYLKNYMVEYDIPGFTLGEKIALCKEEYNPLFVKFSDECYFVAAYYTPDHAEQRNEFPDFCCCKEYTWVGFETAEDVKESWNGDKIVAAFQINIQEFCKNLKTDSTDIMMEHYVFYRPEFSNGVAADPEISFRNLFIYLTKSDEKVLFYSSKIASHEPYSIDCVELDGKYYAKEKMSTKYEDGSYYETNLKTSFGEYYDDLMKIIIVDKYTKNNERYKTNYALFKIGDIETIISK